MNSARHTDFIFSVLGEEWGCVGVVILLALFLFLIVEFLSLAKMSRDRGGTFSVLSLICFFIFHVIINVSMQIGVLPVTGIPLPLVSYGGAATMLFFTAIGLILNVDSRRFVNARAEVQVCLTECHEFDVLGEVPLRPITPPVLGYFPLSTEMVA